MTADTVDRERMARALRLAERGLFTADPNPRVGCVIVGHGGDDARVVGEGWHERTGGPHAEAVALAQAGDKARGATVFVSLEPCCHDGRTPPCTGALIAAGVARVVMAMEDPNPRVAGKGAAELRAAGIVVDSGVLEHDARELNPGFIARMSRTRPFVRAKIAASLDGRTALGSGESKWITGEAARRDVHYWRARSAAILTGVGTVIADDPSLNVRRDDLGDVRPPLRVIADSALRMPSDARLLQASGDTLIACAAAGATAGDALRAAGAEVREMAGADGRVDLDKLLRVLAEMEVNEVLVEAGPALNGALLARGLVDELLVYVAAHVLGTDARGMFALEPVADMEKRIEMALLDVRRVGQDLRLRYRPASV